MQAVLALPSGNLWLLSSTERNFYWRDGVGTHPSLSHFVGTSTAVPVSELTEMDLTATDYFLGWGGDTDSATGGAIPGY